MGNARDRQPSSCELYEGLTDHERRHLSREFVLTRRIPAGLALLRAVPYPLGNDTAAAVTEISRRYVYPWPDFRARYLLPWACDRLAGEEGVTRLPLFGERSGEEVVGLFPDPDDFRDFNDGTDYTYGLAGRRDAEVDEECDALQELVRAAAADELFDLGVSVPLPLPLGTASLTRIPLGEGQWLHRHVVELAEYCAELTAAGYRRLPALDPHRLAWHRVYPPDTDWRNPREADPGAVAELRQRASARLRRYPGRAREVGGQPQIHLDDYAGWNRRLVPDDLLARRATGIVVESWNAWVDQESDGGRVDLCDFVVARVAHPVTVRQGLECAPLDSAACGAALRLRAEAVSELRALAADHVIRTRPDELFTPVQLVILQALEEESPLTADKLYKRAGYSRARLYQPGGIKELMQRDPPLVALSPDRRGYMLTSVRTDRSALD
jgi:hypothetical protein